MKGFTLGQYVAFSWMIEECRMAGAAGVENLKDCVLGTETNEIFDAISEAVDKHCEGHRMELEKTLFRGAGEDLNYAGIVEIRSVVDEVVAKFGFIEQPDGVDSLPH